MKKRIFTISILILAVILNNNLFAQNVAITDDAGYTAHSSAMLDVYSANKGMLIPRFNSYSTLIESVVLPTDGLIAYVVNTGLYIYKENTWIPVTTENPFLIGANGPYLPAGRTLGIGTTLPIANLEIQGGDGETILQVTDSETGLPVLVVYNDGVQFVLPTPVQGKSSKQGSFAVSGRGAKTTFDFITLTEDNIFMGKNSGVAYNSGLNNIFIGNYAGSQFTSGDNNIVIGADLTFSGTNRSNELLIGFTSQGSLIQGDMSAGNESLTLNASTSVNGDLSVYVSLCTLSGDLSMCSDSRYKKDFTKFENVLKNIKDIKGGYYYWKTNDFPEKNFNSRRQIGVIAQEVQKVYPELIHTDNKGYLSVDYTKLTPILLEAIKEQQKQIENLEQRLLKIETTNKAK